MAGFYNFYDPDIRQYSLAGHQGCSILSQALSAHELFKLSPVPLVGLAWYHQRHNLLDPGLVPVCVVCQFSTPHIQPIVVFIYPGRKRILLPPHRALYNDRAAGILSAAVSGQCRFLVVF